MLVQPLRRRPLNAYHQWIDSELVSRLEHQARQLAGQKIYEINSTAVGGGVVELLQSKLPLMLGLGLDANWLVIPPDDRFFKITKGLHNCLQGTCPDHNHDYEYYTEYSQNIARTLPLDGDVYILHDPQSLGLIPILKAVGKRIIWRCHIDLTNADKSTRNWLLEQIEPVEQIIVSLPEYAHGMDPSKIRVVSPAIDPLVAKNQQISKTTSASVLKANKIDLNRPFITQISRYDYFKDPIGVINLYEQVQNYLPDMQCVLLGNQADDDPEGAEVLKAVRARAATCPGKVIILTKSTDILVNALQSQAASVIQYSNREGFGLTVTEAMWKSNLVFARPVGGIAGQIIDGKTGLAASGQAKPDADKLIDTLNSKNMREKLGVAAHEHVRKHFITPIMTEGYLRVYAAF